MGGERPAITNFMCYLLSVVHVFPFSTPPQSFSKYIVKRSTSAPRMYSPREGGRGGVSTYSNAVRERVERNACTSPIHANASGAF